MDSLTQAVLGAAMGEITLGRALGTRAIAWGALLGTLPDLDVLFFPWADAADQLRLHRGLSHSLLVCIAATVIFGPLLSRRWRSHGVSNVQASSFVFLAWSTHVLIDVFTAYGTQIWEPFSNARISTRNLFIIDPFFTLPMVIGLGLTAWQRRTNSTHLNPGRATHIGLLLASLYVGWSFQAQSLIHSAVARSLAADPVPSLRHTLAPTPFNTLLWRIMVEDANTFRIGYRSVCDAHDHPIDWTTLPKGGASPLSDPRSLETVRWFAQDWLLTRIVDDHTYAADLRLGEVFVTHVDGTDALTPVFAWTIGSSDDDTPLTRAGAQRLEPSATLRRIFHRALGNVGDWPVPTSLAMPSNSAK